MIKKIVIFQNPWENYLHEGYSAFVYYVNNILLM